jgi:hypothetical protein
MSEVETSPAFAKAKLLMQAAINSFRAGEKDVALDYFANAQKGFESLDRPADAQVARIWVLSLKKRLHREPHLV